MIRANPFEDALQDLRIAGCIVLHETYEAPWGVSVPPGQELCEALNADPNMRVAPFHYVRRGWFHLRSPACAELKVEQGCIAICPGGKGHYMGVGRPAKTWRLTEMLSGGGGLSTGLSSESTELICGAFLLKASHLNPILAALPDFLIASAQPGSGDPLLVNACDMLAMTLRDGATERAQFTTARLLEILCAEIIRGYARQAPSGWFHAIHDRKIANALQQIHQAPGHAWTVEQLAQAAALSSSRFAARFRDTVGETVGAYLTRWRMILGCRKLEETEDSIDQIAYLLGYGSAPAFSRAFKHAVGMSPVALAPQAKTRMTPAVLGAASLSAPKIMLFCL